ncbi:segregation/condensation protein A [Candidatus Woesearchaeota archaeon]|nr:segregation/condensation protein A [Candidatus Woesearchaeota archaeon]MBW2994281.1 segregation/condensation protein A [Candidatus Woesearchaeota archaeon]
MEDKLFQMLVEDNEISWKAIIYDLIRKEEMDPWDVNVSTLTKKYIERLKKFKEMDLKVSGKVLLAAAMLLKIKSKRLVGDDLNEFDRLLASTDVDEDEFYDDLAAELKRGEERAIYEGIELMPRTPQPRKRKVSVYDLVSALEQALEVKKRRVFNSIRESNVSVPERKFDITDAIKGVYSRILGFFKLNKEKNHIPFSKLVPSDTRKDHVYTFIPLLHLFNENKVHLEQQGHFGEIQVQLKDESEQESENIQD